MVVCREIILDANILIAIFRGADPPFQIQHSSLLLQMVKSSPLKVLVIQKAMQEIRKKYPALMWSIDRLQQELESGGKFRILENAFFDINARQIINMKKDAETEGCNLSFADSAQAFYSSVKKVPLITWDAPLVDYCQLRGISAMRPNEFCSEYEKMP